MTELIEEENRAALGSRAGGGSAHWPLGCVSVAAARVEHGVVLCRMRGEPLESSWRGVAALWWHLAALAQRRTSASGSMNDRAQNVKVPSWLGADDWVRWCGTVRCVAPHSSGCREDGMRAPCKNFSRNSNKPQI
jgi:hypothetical protein